MPRRPGSKNSVPKNDLSAKPRDQRGRAFASEGAIALRESLPDANHPELFNPDRPLTEKQKTFVREWAKGETITSAALRAGYTDSSSMPYKLARDPAILKLYQREKELYEDAAQMSRKKVMDGLMEGIEMAKIQADPGNVIAGWREIGKMCGYYAPVERKVSINVRGDIAMKNLNRLDDATLLKLVKGEITDVDFTEAASTEEEES